MEVSISSSLWDGFIDMVSVISAIANVVLVYVIYELQKNDIREQERRSRDVEQFFNIFLSCRLNYLNQLFADIHSATKTLNDFYDDSDGKYMVNEEVGKLLSAFYYDFISLIEYVDGNLYSGIKNATDVFRDDLSSYLSEDIIDTTKEDYLNEVKGLVNHWQSKVLSVLMSYRGKEDATKKINRPPKTYCVLAILILFIAIAFVLYKDSHENNSEESPIPIVVDSLQIQSLTKTLQSFKKDTLYTIPVKDVSFREKSKRKGISTEHINVRCIRDSIDDSTYFLEIQVPR